ncbi:unnamed protein product [Trichogramma brassicae]|uniref:Uncharacterized protein n=1 Tax=Trichogramma brassicae TaxID=86971 RepID=A0A6H5J2A4_9HYME|nr:unnamed protein product [Trichogramma brassicae]
MKWLLVDYVKDPWCKYSTVHEFISFVVRTGYIDEPDLDEDGKPLQQRTTPVHHAAKDENRFVFPDLFKIYNRFDVNYVDKDGYTHFHAACQFGCDDVVEKFLELGQDPNCIAPKSIDPPLHLALKNKHKKVIQLLLRHGADPNSTNTGRLTPLDIFCKDMFHPRNIVVEFAEIFFEIDKNDDHRRQPLKVDIQDRSGKAPLHNALSFGVKRLVRLLLKYGANPNLANNDGSKLAPVDIFSKTNCSLPTLRKYSDKKKHRFEQFDDVDEWGQTPLHYALLQGKKGRTRSLLRRGANPNFPNADGSTPLHIICTRVEYDVGTLAELFFEVNDEKRQTVHIDAVDKLGRTPLQWAVANLLTPVVVILLERGVDLTKFVFPNETYFAVPYRRYVENDVGHFVHELASDPLVIVECLKKKGFEIGLSDALIIMKFCHRIGTIRTISELYSELFCGKDDDNRHCEACKTDDDYSDDNYYYYYQIGEDTEGSWNDYDSDDACQEDLELLKGLRGKVNWEIEEERRELLRELYPLIQKWRGRLPNLRDIFRKEEIDWLLMESVRNMRDPDLISRGGQFIDFVTRTGYRDKPEVDENDKPLLHNTTPVHYAAKSGYTIVIPLLFKIYTSLDANYIDESGLTHFHAACMADCENVVEKFLQLGQDPNFFEPKTGDSPLHLALAGHSRYVTRLLLKNGADPNSINNEGSTPLHVCQSYSADDMLEIFFMIIDDIQQTVQVDARDKLGRTPLELAVANFQPHAVDLLLNHGADLSNFVFPVENHIVEALKPLRCRIVVGKWRDPNWANADESTPLHIICMRRNDDGLANTSFRITDEIDQLVPVNVRDKSGWTPLQLAVANLLPNVVDVLFDRGADLADFVFPTASVMDTSLKGLESKERKLQIAPLITFIVERLEKRGYKLDRNDAMTIMTFFATHGLFNKPDNLQQFWYDDENFMMKAEFIKINPDLSLTDLIRLRPKEAEKLITYTDYFYFLRGYFNRALHNQTTKACIAYLHEIMSRGFFRRWGLEFLLML